MDTGAGSLVTENTFMVAIIGSLVIKATVLTISFGGPITEPLTLHFLS